MSFLSPAFLLAAAAITLPIALHLLRRRVTRTIPFPALRFLKTSQPHHRRQNFHRRLVLALRCLVLALLAAAFARPFFGQPAPASARASVVVIDNSFSLQAPGRWSQLKAWALAEIGTPTNGDTVGLLLMNPRPTWLVPPTRDTSAAIATLNDLPPGWETTRAEPALRFAADTLASSAARTRKLIYLGDHQALGWAGMDFARPLPSGVTAVFPATPESGVSRQAALLTPTLQNTGDTATASVVIRNFGKPGRHTLRLFAGSDSEVLHTEPIELASGEIRTFRQTVPASSLSKGWIRFALDADDLPADDEAWALAPAEAAARRLLLLDRPPAGAGADYINIACQALATLPPSLRMGGIPATAWPVPAAVVLRNEASFTRDSAARLDAFLAAGGSALLFLDGSPDQFRWLATHGIVPVPQPAGAARVRDWTIDHPLVAPLAEANLRSLVGWTFKRGWSLPATSVEPLASWTDGSPALGELRLGAGRVLIAGFTPDRRDGDWPLAPAFVPFLHRTILHLLDTGLQAGTPALVGQPLALPQGEPGSWRALAGPFATRPATSVSGGTVPQAPGIYEWSRGHQRSLHAVNLPPEESDLAPWTEGSPWAQLISASSDAGRELSRTSSSVHLAAQDAEQQNPLWWWCFAAMAVFALTELAFANRTTR
ncbi:MAG: putative rane protein [Rariglobus sp.]|nr:putative rane protein [Rariglobus sp.]